MRNVICPNCQTVIPLDSGFSAVDTRHRLRQEQYERIGKRCSNCHAYKPTTAYNKSVNSSDRLQSVCRECGVLNFTLRASGGMTVVRATREALRLKNDALNKAAGRL